jgi:hypothetical protein
MVAYRPEAMARRWVILYDHYAACPCDLLFSSRGEGWPLPGACILTIAPRGAAWRAPPHHVPERGWLGGGGGDWGYATRPLLHIAVVKGGREGGLGMTAVGRGLSAPAAVGAAAAALRGLWLHRPGYRPGAAAPSVCSACVPSSRPARTQSSISPIVGGEGAGQRAGLHLSSASRCQLSRSHQRAPIQAAAAARCCPPARLLPPLHALPSRISRVCIDEAVYGGV